MAGIHLMVDGYVSRVLKKRESKKLLHDLIKLVGMRAVGSYAYRQTHVGPSGWQMLMESHISFDYMDDVVCVNLFSCKPFPKDYSPEIIAKIIIEKFEIYHLLKNKAEIRGFGDDERDKLEAERKRARLATSIGNSSPTPSSVSG